MTFKAIPQYPSYEINRDGIIRHGETKSSRLPLQTIAATHDVYHLAVNLFGNIEPCWELIWMTFFRQIQAMKHDELLIPRDGNFLNLREDNLFPFNVSTNCRIRYASDIHGVWHASIMEKVPCNKMAERLNLPQYGAHEFRVLIGEILLTGIR